jgi:hypothetical protein
VSTVAKLAPLLPVLVVCGGLFVVYVRKGPSLALGALAALSSYALLFPVMWPHPQWYFYYGLALVAAAATIPLHKNRRRFLLAVGVVQGVSVALAAQWLPNNADITMTGRALGLDIHALGDVYPVAAEFLQRWGRKLLATTLVLSWAVFALEWWQRLRNERTEAAVLEKNACDVNFVARLCVWSGVAFLVTWLALLVAVVV